MAKISKTKKGRTNGGFTRVFNNKELGSLISRVHSTVIRAGNELEKEIFVPNIDNLDDFLEQADKNSFNKKNLFFVATKKIIRKSKLKFKKFPDALIFLIKNRECYIIELKDGDNFDTKKAIAEKNTLEEISSFLGEKTSFKIKYFLCGFNSENIDELFYGLKKEFKKENLMTGRQICEILNLKFDKIIEKRKIDAEENILFFIDELLKIKKLKKIIESKLKQINKVI